MAFKNEFIGKTTNMDRKRNKFKSKGINIHNTHLCSQEYEKQEHGQARAAGGDCHGLLDEVAVDKVVKFV